MCGLEEKIVYWSRGREQETRVKLMVRSGQGPASMGFQGHLKRIWNPFSRKTGRHNGQVLKAHFVCHVDKGLESILKSDTETTNRRWSHCAGCHDGTEQHDSLSLSLERSQSSKGSRYMHTGLLMGHVLCHMN